ncbi:unnamed protein product [Didymodactylos carnosus]|uniref:Alpha/beta hydrolase n=1 Tax=Didymodactylos carnosus TaxID=1234261 RepID=A0A8S2DLY3_9BILA|nr:unnamed protein product [Didymodactylos carnosus]CAF3756035.1 unnamed protein product [Didymodactylos carnosus]
MTPGIINRHWYKWIQTELQKLGFDAIAPPFPDEREAKNSIWIPFLIHDLEVGAAAEALQIQDEKPQGSPVGPGQKSSRNDILIGHSSGAMAILRLCEQIKVKGLILVSAGYDNNDKDQSWNWNKIKSNTQWIEQFHSSDDPFTSVDSSRHIAKQLHSTYHEFNDRNHFLCNEFPDLINVIQDRCGLS